MGKISRPISFEQLLKFLIFDITPKILKTNTLFLALLLSFALFLRAYGNEWRTYGFDDQVVIQVPQQPTVMDTLDQRMLFADCDYGRLVVQGLDDIKEIYNKDEIQKYYDHFLIGYTRTAHVEILSKQYDTLRAYHCLAFTSRFKDSNMLSIAKVVWINNRAYLFQYVYDESNHVEALNEAYAFFKTIRFRDMGKHQFSMTKVYNIVGIGMFMFIASGVVGAIILGIYFVNKKLSARRV